MASKGITSVEVEIFGATYHVRGENDPDHLQELASFVDEKMREVASHVSTVDTAKIAILTALNIADELIQCREALDGERGEISEKVAELTGELENALRG